MAKTIEELAEKYYGGISYANDEFIVGANKVLEKIESILDAPMSYVVESGWQGQLNDLVGMIRQRINELKGM